VKLRTSWEDRLYIVEPLKTLLSKPQRLVEVVWWHEEISHSMKMVIHGTRKGEALGLRDNYPIGGWLSRVQYWIITLIDAFRILYSEILMIKCVTDQNETEMWTGCKSRVWWSRIWKTRCIYRFDATRFEVGRTTRNHGRRHASLYLMCLCGVGFWCPYKINQPKPSFQGDTG